MSSLANSQIAGFALTTIVIGALIVLFIYGKTNSKQEHKKPHKTIFGLTASHETKLKLAPKLALVTDLDHTLFGSNATETHDESNKHILKFNDIWLKHYVPNNSVLIYATGRNLRKYRYGVEEWDILKPDILVTQDGVSIHWFNKSLLQQVSNRDFPFAAGDGDGDSAFLWYDKSWESILSEGWDQQFAEEIHDQVYDTYNCNLLPLPKGSKSKELFRIGILCKGRKLAKEIEQFYIKKVNGYNAIHNCSGKKMEIHSFTCIERNLKQHKDAYWTAFTPAKAGKGAAVEFLRKRLRLKGKNVICMGDSGNDISMLGVDGYNSVILGNASQELLRFYDENHKNRNMIKTKQFRTLGVIEGLQHYGAQLLDSA